MNTHEKRLWMVSIYFPPIYLSNCFNYFLLIKIENKLLGKCEVTFLQSSLHVGEIHRKTLVSSFMQSVFDMNPLTQYIALDIGRLNFV